MDSKKDYYAILGISKDASADDIKKAYRKLAMQYHPDRWANGTEQEKKNAEEKFKEISEANEVLSDPDKRSRYDNGGIDFDASGFDPMDMFREHFKGFEGFGFGGFSSFFGGGNRNQVKRGDDIRVDLNISLKEAYNGGYKSYILTRDCKCPDCNGTGSADKKSTECPYCHGRGIIEKHIQIAPNMFQGTQEVCRHCNGTGKIVSNPCKKCNGSGIIKKTTTENIEIIRGVGNGMYRPIEGMGNAPAGGGINGNLNVFYNVKDDNYFKRPDAINLIHYEDVPFNDCLLGFTHQFDAIDGTKVTVNAPELTPNGKAFIFKGKGMPDPNNQSHVGDYAIVINYALPYRLTDKQREMLKNFYK